MKHFLIALALIVGASSIFAPSTAVASCADKCSKALDKAMDACWKARTPRVLQGCMTYVQQKFYKCQRKCAHKGTSTDMVPVSRGAKKTTGYTKDINARCEAKWADNYRMQKYCRKRQNAAFTWVGRHLKRHKLGDKAHQKGPHFKIASKCWAKWTDQWKQNWPMVKYCIENQERAYRSL